MAMMAFYSIDHLCSILILFLTIVILPCVESNVVACRHSSCSINTQHVHFPFRLMNRPGQGARCGYPGFGLSCNNQNQTLLNLPASGDFSIQYIDYGAQTAWLNDPDGCLPRRLLNFSLSGSPFRAASATRNFTFFNCSSSSTSVFSPLMRTVPCLEGTNRNYTVVYALTSNINSTTRMNCEELATVRVPIPIEFGSDLGEGVLLTWDTPDCKSCLARRGVCGLKIGSASEIGCSIRTQSRITSLPRSVKYGIIIGVGIPSLICLIGIACCIGGKISAYGLRRQHHDSGHPDLTRAMARPLELRVVRGLDGPTIESYPKTLLGESRRLPNPGDNVCPICLGEYRPKESLRTIPECNHYFHSDCIDQWLRMNSTCPLCRNSPSGSSAKSPTESTSSAHHD